MAPLHAIYWLWGLWYASWLASLIWTKRASARPNVTSHGPYQLATMAGLFLLFGPPFAGQPLPQLWNLPGPAIWALFALIALAFAFCWWARITMGPLWSGLISRTEDHHIIDSGPFAVVRHPIYTAIIFAALATSLALGTAAALAGAATFALAFWMKARIEERFLAEELGAEAYGAYRARVPMLIPFARR